MGTAKICLEELQGSLGMADAKWRPVGNNIDDVKLQDETLIEGKIRPLVQEEVRKEVDAEMRVLLHQLKASTYEHIWP